MKEKHLRYRAFVARRFVPLFVVFLLLASLGAAATYTSHVAVDTTVEERTVDAWETKTSIEHSATVTEPSAVYAANETLENRSVYFHAVTPELRGGVAGGYEAAEASDVDVALDLSLLFRSRDEESGVTHWQRRDDLGGDRAEDVDPGETVRVPFSFNVSEYAQMRERVGRELGAEPGDVELILVADLRVEGVIDGKQREESRTTLIPISLGRGTFSVDASETGPQRHETTAAVTVPREYGPLRTVGGPVALVVGLLGVAALLGVRRRGLTDLTAREREELTYAGERAEFDEWISTIRLPEEPDRPLAQAESLRDLVDFAIDTDQRVIEDPESGNYYILADDLAFVYSPPGGSLEEGTNQTTLRRLNGAWEETASTENGERVAEDSDGMLGDAPQDG